MPDTESLERRLLALSNRLKVITGRPDRVAIGLHFTDVAAVDEAIELLQAIKKQDEADRKLASVFRSAKLLPAVIIDNGE